MQERLMRVLFEHCAPIPCQEQPGIPVEDLKVLVGGDRSNLRRAVRTLKERGLVEELATGGRRRVRLTSAGDERTFWTLVAEARGVRTQK